MRGDGGGGGDVSAHLAAREGGAGQVRVELALEGHLERSRPCIYIYIYIYILYYIYIIYTRTTPEGHLERMEVL